MKTTRENLFAANGADFHEFWKNPREFAKLAAKVLQTTSEVSA
jgi:hypothetical protein